MPPFHRGGNQGTDSYVACPGPRSHWRQSWAGSRACALTTVLFASVRAVSHILTIRRGKYYGLKILGNCQLRETSELTRMSLSFSDSVSDHTQCWGMGFWGHKPAAEPCLRLVACSGTSLLAWHLPPCQSFGVAGKVCALAANAVGKPGHRGTLPMKPVSSAPSGFLMNHWESWVPSSCQHQGLWTLKGECVQGNCNRFK